MRTGGRAIAYRASCRTLANGGSRPTFRAPPRTNPSVEQSCRKHPSVRCRSQSRLSPDFRSSLVAQARPAATTTPAAVTSTTRRAFTPADWYKLTTLRVAGRVARRQAGRVHRDDRAREREQAAHRGLGRAGRRRRADALHVAEHRELEPALLAGRQVPVLHLARAPGGRGSTWALRMDQPGGEAVQLDDYPSGSLPRDRQLRGVERAGHARIARRLDARGAIRSRACRRWRGRRTARSRSRSTRRASTAATSPTCATRRTAAASCRARARRAAWRPAQIWRAERSDDRRRSSSPTRSTRIASPRCRPTASGSRSSPTPALRPDSVVQAGARLDRAAAVRREARRGRAQRRRHLRRAASTGGAPRRLTERCRAARVDSRGRPTASTIAFIGGAGAHEVAARLRGRRRRRRAART